MSDSATEPATDPIWAAVDRLVDRTPNLADLRAHGLHLFAAKRWREQDRPVPLELIQAEVAAGVVAVTTPTLLARIRAAHEEAMILMKGPAVACLYPDPSLRSYNDLDIVVLDAVAVERALVDAGFQEVGDASLLRAGHHHQCPLQWPGMPLRVEVHSRPNWPDRMSAPEGRELFAVAESNNGISEGFLALPKPHHALLLAAHSWAHAPLASVRDLLDVAAMSRGLDPAEMIELARAWRLDRIWRVTEETLSFLREERTPARPLRLWARNLVEARDRTVFESHVENWLSPFWALPFHEAVIAAALALGDEVRPVAGESWRSKLRRMRKALRYALAPKFEHDYRLGKSEARKRRSRRRP